MDAPTSVARISLIAMGWAFMSASASCDKATEPDVSTTVAPIISGETVVGSAPWRSTLSARARADMATRLGLAESAITLVHERQRIYDLTGQQVFTFAFNVGETRQMHLVAFDATGTEIDPNASAVSEGSAWIARYGKLHPGLASRLDRSAPNSLVNASPGGLIDVAIQPAEQRSLTVTPPVLPAFRMPSGSADTSALATEIANFRSSNLRWRRAVVSASRAPVINRLKALGRVASNQDSASTTMIYVQLTPEDIRVAESWPEVLEIFAVSNDGHPELDYARPSINGQVFGANGGSTPGISISLDMTFGMNGRSSSMSSGFGTTSRFPPVTIGLIDNVWQN